MLVVSRRESETIRVGDITIMVVRIQAGSVRIGIEAPPNVTILRGELVDKPRKGSGDVRDRP